MIVVALLNSPSPLLLHAVKRCVLLEWAEPQRGGGGGIEEDKPVPVCQLLVNIFPQTDTPVGTSRRHHHCSHTHFLYLLAWLLSNACLPACLRPLQDHGCAPICTLGSKELEKK